MKVKHDINGGNKAEKLKSLVTDPGSPPSACVKLWAIVCSTMVLLWVCAVQITIQDNKLMEPKYSFSYSYPYSVPPEMSTGVFKNNGYLKISSNGGLNQMRTGICDMVAIARYLNVTLIVPDLDDKSYWNDHSEFKDIFDVDFFISSLRDEVPILKELPPEQKRKVESESLYTMYPIAFASLRYYYTRILPRMQQNQVVLFTLTDGRLANNGLPEEIQKLRCRVNYKALRFTPQIDELGRKIVRLLRQKGPFLVLHLRYEMDMLAFTGCAEGCSRKEIQDLVKWRDSHHPEWQHRGINSSWRRRSGMCPLTPEETALVLQALGIDQNITIYIAAGNIYGGERRMASLRAAYPNLVNKETIIDSMDLRPFQNHSNQMAALDYIVALESDIFVPSYGGNMAKVVEGHRRYLGFKKTILPNIHLLVNLIDQYKNGTLSWIEFSILVKASHADRMGQPTKRLEIPGQPREEDYFYSNPQECLPSLA